MIRRISNLSASFNPFTLTETFKNTSERVGLEFSSRSFSSSTTNPTYQAVAVAAARLALRCGPAEHYCGNRAYRLTTGNRVSISEPPHRYLASLSRKRKLAQEDEEGKIEEDKTQLKRNLLKDALVIDEVKAKKIFKKYPDLLEKSENSLSQTLDFLTKKGILLPRIFRFPWVLLSNPEELERKVASVMAMTGQPFEMALPLVKWSNSKLKDLVFLWKKDSKLEVGLKDYQGSRVVYLAKKLECSETEVMDMISKVECIGTMPFVRLDLVLCTLLEGGVNRCDILTDPWIFEHNVAKMKERIESSKIKGLTVIKPWILRSPDAKYESYASRMTRERALLQGCEDIASFLQRRLPCSKAQAQNMMLRVPSIRTASAMKLNEMIEFLYSKGFSATHLMDTPRILGHSVETISERIKELSRFGSQPPYLPVLCKTSKHYFTFIRKLSRNITPAKYIESNSSKG